MFNSECSPTTGGSSIKRHKHKWMRKTKQRQPRARATKRNNVPACHEGASALVNMKDGMQSPEETACARSKVKNSVLRKMQCPKPSDSLVASVSTVDGWQQAHEEYSRSRSKEPLLMAQPELVAWDPLWIEGGVC